MKQVLKPLGVFLLWNLVVGIFLIYVDPVIALPAALALSAALVWGYLLPRRRNPSAARRWATLRLRPLHGATLHWTLISIPILLVLSWALGDVYTQLVPVPPESLNPFEQILATGEGRLLIAIFAVAVAPIVEEFIFRGLIQRSLERRHGPVVGIMTAAGIFALVHVLPWVFPLHFFLGVAFGFAVWATRSIWTGVLLHTANNTAAILGVALTGEEPPPTGTLWEIGLTADLGISVAVLAVSLVAAIWTAARLREAGGHTRLRTKYADLYVRP